MSISIFVILVSIFVIFVAISVMSISIFIMSVSIFVIVVSSSVIIVSIYVIVASFFVIYLNITENHFFALWFSSQVHKTKKGIGKTFLLNRNYYNHCIYNLESFPFKETFRYTSASSIAGEWAFDQG